MRLSGQFQTFLLTKRFCKHKKHKMHISEQKQKRQHFYALKKHLRGKKSLVRLFAFLCFLCFLCFLYFLCFLCLQNLFVKINKKFKIALMTSFTLLPDSSDYQHNFFFFLRSFFLSQSFSIITIFFITIFITILFNLFTIFLNLFTTCDTIFMKISQRMNFII